MMHWALRSVGDGREVKAATGAPCEGRRMLEGLFPAGNEKQQQGQPQAYPHRLTRPSIEIKELADQETTNAHEQEDEKGSHGDGCYSLSSTRATLDGRPFAGAAGCRNALPVQAVCDGSQRGGLSGWRRR